MKNKYHNRLFSFFLISFTATTATMSAENIWTDSPVGQCYKSTNEYLLYSYGEKFSEDENLITYPFKLKPPSKHSDDVQFHWIADVTTGTNFTRVLFRVRPNIDACAILLVPLASSVEYGASKTLMPPFIRTTDTPPPGFKTTAVTYKFNSKGEYDPTVCTKSERNKKPKKIVCSQLKYD